MTIKVGQVPFINYEPFYIDMERRGLELHQMDSRDMVIAIQQGELDAGPVPLVDSFKMEDRFMPVAGFCLAASGPSGSNLLYSTVPIEKLGGARISTSDVESTPSHLLQVILSEKYHVASAEYVGANEDNEALILTGTQALRRRRGVRGYPHRYDLGREWYSLTALPFVFARWMVRNDMDPKEAALLEDTLYVGLEDGVDNLFHISEPRDDILMLARDVVEYIQGYRYFVGLSEQKSINLFRQHWSKINRGG